MLKNVYDAVSKFFKRTFCCFSLLTLSFAVVGMLIKSNEYAKYIASDIIFSFFVFSMLMALSFGIADLVKNNSILRGAVRFVLSFVSLAAVFFFGGAFNNYVEANGVQNKGFSILAISFVFVLIYVVCSIVSLIINTISNNLSNSKKEYESMFDNNK